jgi:hypothetical protein
MPNKLILSMMGASGILLSTFSQAADVDLKKDEWLKKLRGVAPSMVCKGFTENEGLNKQLALVKIDYDKCLRYIPAIYDKCQAQYAPMMPAIINDEAAAKWGSALGDCIGTDFAVNYLIAAPKTPAADSATSKTSETGLIARDPWLEQLKLYAPEVACKQIMTNKSIQSRLKDHDITHVKCLSMMPAILLECQTKLYSTIPANLTLKDTHEWGEKMGKCIGSEFVKKQL